MEEGLDNLSSFSDDDEMIDSDHIDDEYGGDSDDEDGGNSDDEDSSSGSKQLVAVRDVVDLDKRLKKLYATYPQTPKKRDERLVFWLYHVVKFGIFFDIRSDQLSEPNPNDTDEQLKEKAFGIHYFDIWQKFKEETEVLASDLFKKIYVTLVDECGGSKDHPVVAFMNELVKHKELHSRGCKGNPNMQRTKKDISEGSKPVFNLITGEEYDESNPDHGTWRMLIINPLPSDDDYRQIDPKEGDDAQQLMVAFEEIQDPELAKARTPYAVYVTPHWDKLLRLLHTMLWMDTYIYTRIVGVVTQEQYDQARGMCWDDVWKSIAKEHHSKPVGKLSREVKKMPPVISRIAEFRDLLKDVLDLLSK